MATRKYGLLNRNYSMLFCHEHLRSCFFIVKMKVIYISRRIDKQKHYDEFIDLCKEKGYIPISTINDYQNSRSKLKYLCPLHGIQETTLFNFRRHGCPKCGHEIINQKNTLSKDHVIQIVESKNNDKLLNPDEYDKVKSSNLKVRCGSCGRIFTTSLASLQASDGACKKCADIKTGNGLRHDKDYIKNAIEGKNNNVLLNPNDYVDARTNNLQIKCGSCGRIFTVSYSNYCKNLTGKCPTCNTNSYGEYLITLFLEKHNVKYYSQYKFEDCKDKKPLPFDFYLPDYNLCIEFDGEQHYVGGFGDDSFFNTLLHDGMKNNYCSWNGIKLLRISYFDIKNINDILTDELKITT